MAMEKQLLTAEGINTIIAQIIKAEFLGDEAQAIQLRARLDKAQKMRNSLDRTAADSGKTRGAHIKTQRDTESEVILLTQTNRSGMTYPLKGCQTLIEHGRQKRKFESTHEISGKRTKYFDDDDKYSLKDLVEREKMSTAEDANATFTRLAGRHIQGDDKDMDDKMVDKAAMKQSASLMESKEKQLAIIEHKKMSASLDKCGFCFQNVPKHLIIAIGVKVYLCLPKHRSMVEGHCFIIPIHHETQGTKCDEDIWDEIKIFRKGLTAMFKDLGKDCIFMETSMNLKRYPHAFIECIPVDKEIGDLAPIYFKKAIQECESEWVQNKKVIDLSQKDVRKAIPKGFPYFCVDFGSQGGYGRVIEDEKSFTSYFGREIVGGMLDLDATVWRRPHSEQFEEQRKKVLRFAEQWKPYDWTQRLK